MQENFLTLPFCEAWLISWSILLSVPSPNLVTETWKNGYKMNPLMVLVLDLPPTTRFTAYDKVCFHFQCKTEVLAEALERFSCLFLPYVIQKACYNREEVRRINAELDKNDLFTRELPLTKKFINPDHPYSRMTMGSLTPRLL
jgi:hypothetical protein